MGNNVGKLQASSSTCGSLGPLRRTAIVTGLLDVVEAELVRLARSAVDRGDRFFSVAIVRKADLSLVACGRDKSKSKDPTATAELNAIQGFFTVNNRPNPRDCIFLCIHEPSPMALYQIALCGFDNFVYVFTKQEMKELGDDGETIALNAIFNGASQDESYKQNNDYWTAYSLVDMIQKCEKKSELLTTVEKVKTLFGEMMVKESALLAPPTPSKETAA